MMMMKMSTPVVEPPPVVEPVAPPDDIPDDQDPYYKCSYCNATDADPNTLCGPIRIA